MIEGICQDIFIGGFIPISSALEWIFLYLSSHPKVISTLQSQLDLLFGSFVLFIYFLFFIIIIICYFL